MLAADTNVLVRVYTRDEPRQVAVAEQFLENGAWVSLVALVETVWVLGDYYDRTHAELVKVIESMVENDRLVLQDADAVSDALELFRAQPALGFSDCLMLALARKAGHLPLGTFDRRLAKFPGAQKL